MGAACVEGAMTCEGDEKTRTALLMALNAGSSSGEKESVRHFWKWKG